MRGSRGWKEWFLPFFSELVGKETPKLVLVRAFRLQDSRTGTGDGCLFLLEPRASGSKPTRKNGSGAAVTGHGIFGFEASELAQDSDLRKSVECDR